MIYAIITNPDGKRHICNVHGGSTKIDAHRLQTNSGTFVRQADGTYHHILDREGKLNWGLTPYSSYENAKNALEMERGVQNGKGL